ncbi:MAG: hypothetical protein AAB408_02050, partial [Patescibacteria group bacterium]
QAVVNHPWYVETAPRFGFVKSHEANFSRVVFGAFAIFLLSWRLFAKEVRLFFLAVFLTALVVANEQVITGQYLFNHHFHWYYNTPLTIFFFVTWGILLVSRFVNRPIAVRSVVLIGVLLLFGNGIARQTQAYRTALPFVHEEQRYAPVYAWLNTATPKDATVFGPLPIVTLVPALTHSNAYYTGSALYTLISNERLLHSYLLFTYLERVPKDQIRTYLEEHRTEISYMVYGNQYRFIPGVCLTCFPDAVIDDLVRSYENLNDQNFVAGLQKYPVRYLIWDKQKNPPWGLDALGLKSVFEAEEIVVYDVEGIP